MLDLDRKIGPMRLRAWGLLVNFVFNGTALYGLAGVLGGTGGLLPLIAGVAGTAVCIAVLAIPSRD